MAIQNTQYPRLAALVGTGRSGTTWAGSVLNAHPEVAYRFEPFHRRRNGDVDIERCFRSLWDGRFDAAEVPAMYDALIRADPLTEKPPFFEKTDLPSWGQLWFWRLARVLPFARQFFEHRFTPRDGRLLIFKEVSFGDCIRGLLVSGAIPLVYIMRHPCATVASFMRGQREGKLPTGQLTVLDSLVAKHDAGLLDRIGLNLDQLDDTQKNALLWRLDTEKAVSALDSAGHGLLITYEQLCEDAYSHFERICVYFSIDFHPAMRAFLDRLYGLRDGDARKLRNAGDPYFTVYRNPREEKDRWKKNMTLDEIAKVESVVIDSPAYLRGAELGGW